MDNGLYNGGTYQFVFIIWIFSLTLIYWWHGYHGYFALVNYWAQYLGEGGLDSLMAHIQD
jgi:hypothetical protein